MADADLLALNDHVSDARDAPRHDESSRSKDGAEPGSSPRTDDRYHLCLGCHREHRRHLRRGLLPHRLGRHEQRDHVRVGDPRRSGDHLRPSFLGSVCGFDGPAGLLCAGDRSVGVCDPARHGVGDPRDSRSGSHLWTSTLSTSESACANPAAGELWFSTRSCTARSTCPSPTALKYDYELVYAEVLRRSHPGKGPLNAFFIGGGGFVFPRYLEEARPGSTIAVAEIDPLVTRVALEMFGISPDSTIRPIPPC